MPSSRRLPAFAVAAVIATAPAGCATVEPTVHEPQPAVTIDDEEGTTLLSALVEFTRKTGA